jgi:hypothetical protein
MPPDRSRKYTERLNLASQIEELGTEMSPCTNCEKHGRTCVVLNEKSKKCSECVRRGQSCDVVGHSPGEWASLRREQDRLKFERDAAFATAMEGLARVQRLEKQQELLKKRGAEMIRRGFQTLDELEETEERERKEREEAVLQEQRAQATVTSNSADPSGDPLADLGIDPSDPFWATLDFGGGTPQASQGT